MADATGSWKRTPDRGLGRRSCIRLRAEHPSHYRAARLLSSLGGMSRLPAEGLVYGFLTTPARDAALHLVRMEMGWSVASPFEGRDRLPGAGLPSE